MSELTETLSAQESEGIETKGIETEDNQPTMETPEEPGNVALHDESWMSSIFRPLLIAIMAACMVIAFLSFLRRFMPFLPAIYTELLIVMGVLASIIGSVSTTWLAQPGHRSHRAAGYRLAEIAFILFLTRVGIWVFAGTWPSLEFVLLRPVDALLDGYFMVGLFVVLMAWIMSTAMTGDLLAMALQPDDIYMARSFNDRWQDTARPVYTDRGAILRRFVVRWVAGGIFLVLVAVGSRIDMPEGGFLGVVRQNLDPTVITAIIIYFLLGLVLISQGQLALLRARWALAKTPSTPSILRNWPLYALILIGIIGIIAALMPLGGTFWLARILSAIIWFIYDVLFEIFRFFMSLLLLILSLFGGEEQQETPAEQPAPPQQFPPPAPPAAESGIPPWAGGALFWMTMILLLGYAAYIYFSGKGFTFAWASRLWQMLRLRWQQLFGAYQEWQISRLRAAADDDTSGGSTGRGGLLSWLGLRNLDPNQRVRYYYLALLERAERAGMARDHSETPSRYGPRLAQQASEEPADQEAIQTLTDAFIQVRYAGTTIPKEQVSDLKRLWNRLKRILRT